MVLTEEAVWGILEQLGVDIEYETDTDYVGYCPFHNNVHSPAFTISKTTGMFFCHNASCNEHGNLRKLIKDMTGADEMRIGIMLYEAEQQQPSLAEKRKLKEVEIPEFEQSKVDKLHEVLLSNRTAISYLRGRGFSLDTMKHFKLGFNPRMNMVSVPMFDVDGKPVGVVGRSIMDKQFKNSPKLPKKIIPWNIHNAKRFNSVVVTEASFDAMHVHQAGFPGTVALLGNYFSDHHADYFDRYFDHIILGLDDDEGGNSCAEQIVSKLPHKRISWAMCATLPRYSGHKDLGEVAETMGSNAVGDLIKQAESNLRYRTLLDKFPPPWYN